MDLVGLWARFLPSWYPWILFTPGVVALTRRFPVRRAGWPRVIGVHVFASLLFVLAHLMLLGWFRVLTPPPGVPARVLLDWVVGALWSPMTQAGFMAYAGVVVVSQAIDGARALRRREVSAARLEGQLAKARMAALQTQLQPHFLFNTLNAVMVLMHEDVQKAEGMLLRLGDLLRLALDQDGKSELSLEEELVSVKCYVEIEQVRFPDRLRVEYDIDEAVRHAMVPNMLLQPLVENAIRHGIASQESGGVICVRAHRRGSQLELLIEDDGAGLCADHKEGIGLFNTRERLKERYGIEQEFEISPGRYAGTQVRIHLPLQEKKRA